MKEYLSLLRDILANGARREDRTGVGALSVFGRQTRLDLARGFPLLTTKKIHINSVVCEMLWFLRGDTNIRYLRERGVTIWDEWADDDGEIGPLYGAQWRRWKTPDGEQDQIAAAIRDIKTRPHSRRIVVSAMNIADFPDERLPPRENAARGKMALAPCHAFFQFYVDRGRLSCLLYCRSQDVFLGTPFNWAGYALLVHLVAQQCDLAPGELVWTGGDCHLYLNHLRQARAQLARAPHPPPRLVIRRRARTVFDYEPEDFAFENYRHHPPIKAPIAV